MVLARRTRGLLGEVRKQPFAGVVPSTAAWSSTRLVTQAPVWIPCSAKYRSRVPGVPEGFASAT
jgi:hypothetical protein